MPTAKRRLTGGSKPSSRANPRRAGGSGAANGTRSRSAAGAVADSEKLYTLRLYVAGQTPKSLASFATLKRLCEEHLPGRYKIEVIDLVENPQLAAGDQILALPTLVRKLPPPLKRIIGNISDEERFLIGMDLRPTSL
jgi:circadian clock protein KaiB